MTVAINTLIIFALVLAVSFIISLVLDLILLAISPKRNGLYFNRAKKNKEDKSAPAKFVEQDTYNEPVIVTPYTSTPTITPYSELDKVEESFALDFNDDSYEETGEIDFNKALEEEDRLMRQNERNKNANFTSQQTNLSFSETLKLFDEDLEEEVEEEDITKIVKEVQAQAMKEIEEEGAEKVRFGGRKRILLQDIEDAIASAEVPVVQEEKEVVVEEAPKRKIPTAKIIFKTVVNAPQPQPVEIVEPEVVEVKDEDEWKRIREDVFNIRVHAFKELQNRVAQQEEQKEEKEEIKPEVAGLKEDIGAKLQEKLDKLQEQTEALIQTNQLAVEETEDIKEKIENIEKATQQVVVVEGARPIHSKDYYVNRLSEIEEELLEVEKDLRKNKREFNPLKRIKKTFDRDVVKLRRKEALVAKQKLKIYGVNNTDNIDEEKVKLLEEEVQVLKKLKESVHKCEEILEQNKDRYPVLENSNRILTRHVDSLKKEMEAVQKELEWFENNEN